MTTNEEYRELIALIRELESKLTATITAGLQAVNLAIASMIDAHHKALLEQERRNAGFADRDRVEVLARHLHDASNEVTDARHRLGDVERRQEAIAAKSDQILATLNDRSLKLLSGSNGYITTTLLMLGTALLTYLLSHIH